MQGSEDQPNRSLGGKMTVLLALASILFRLNRSTYLWNITPVGALGLFGGSRLRSWIAFAVPISVMAVSDVLLNKIYNDKPFNLFVYGCYALNVLWGWLFLRKVTPLGVAGISLLSSVQFFIITNFGVWLGNHGMPGGYEKSLAGLLACYNAGIPFFHRTLIGDLGFSALFFGLYAWAASAGRATTAKEAL